jgi:hypothetical protein
MSGYWTDELLREALREAMATGEYSVRFVLEGGREERSVYVPVPEEYRDPEDTPGLPQFFRIDLDGEVVAVLCHDDFCDHGEGRVGLWPDEAARARELFGTAATVIRI